MLFLSQLIEKAYKNNGVITAYVFGEFGLGKTAYALWVAYDIYKDWNKVLEYLFFKPQEAVRVIGRAIEKNERIPLIIMDDAGLWLDRLTWYERDKISFMELFNLIRSITGGIIFTTPSEELPRQILNKSFFRIKIELADINELDAGTRGALISLMKKYNLSPLVSKATGYRLRTLPSFMKFVKKTFIDYYPTHYPIYQSYTVKRQEALKYYYTKLLEAIHEEEKETRRKTKRPDVFKLIEKRLKEGTPVNKIVKELMAIGIPRSTAYYYVKKLQGTIELL